MGYAQAKWVAEQLVVAARDRGLETTIYRPSLVSGHSETGDCKLGDLIPRLAQGCVELGCAPDFGTGMIDFSPVDFVSRAIVHLSRQADNADRAFNLSHPRPIPWTRLVHRFENQGRPLELVPYAEWLERLERLSQGSALRALVPFFNRAPESLFKLPPSDCRLAQEALRGSSIECLDQEILMDRYLEYFRRTKWIPGPPRKQPDE